MEMSIDNNYVSQGWQCPICKRVYSPTTPMCMFCGGEQKITTTTSFTTASRLVNELCWGSEEQEDGRAEISN